MSTDREAVRAQLSIALRLLRARAQTVFDIDPSRTGTVEEIASRWAYVLTSPDVPADQAQEVGTVVLESLIDAERVATSEFWASALGQALARVGSVPEAVSIAAAGAILGVSRQRAHELVKGGKLRGTNIDRQPAVTGDSVLARLALHP